VKSVLKNLLCRFLAVAVMVLPFQHAQAGMIGANQSMSAAAVQADRDIVLNFLNRSQTVEQLQSLGVDAQSARDRVAAMTDDEISAIAGKVKELPAGGLVGLLLVVLLVVLIGVVVQRR
jgi:hypothetical protein